MWRKDAGLRPREGAEKPRLIICYLSYLCYLFLFSLSFFQYSFLSYQMSSSAISAQLKEPKLTWCVWMNRHLNESDSWLGHTSGVTAATHLVLISSLFGIFYFFGYKTQRVLCVLSGWIYFNSGTHSLCGIGWILIQFWPVLACK